MPPAHLKGALVDKYAEIALFDAAENQRVILEAQAAEAAKKAEMKAALDMQVRMAQEAVLRDREEDRQWVRKEQERIAIWNAEEKSKIESQRSKETTIRKQREQQLRELQAMRERERTEQQHYDMGILKVHPSQTYCCLCVCCVAACGPRAGASRPSSRLSHPPPPSPSTEISVMAMPEPERVVVIAELEAACASEIDDIAPVEPGLKPYQPIHRSRTPLSTCGTE